MNEKYTSDGKKVVVIGKLNATETIVQEIFVLKDGSEIPSGEQFVTKSLHDQPVVSWQQKRKGEIDQALARMEKQLSETSDRTRREQKLAAARVKALAQVATKATAESLATLEDFVAGRITHVLMDTEYGSCRIKPFDDITRSDDSSWSGEDAIKLLSLFGRADGTLQWRIHQYYDHSGCTHIIIPARGLAEAQRMAQELFDARVELWRNDKKVNPPSPESYKDAECSPLALVVPEDIRAYWANVLAEQKASKIALLEKQLQEAKSAS